MRGLLLLWGVGVVLAGGTPPLSAEDAPAAQPVPAPDGEAERPLASPARPVVMPDRVVGCMGSTAPPLGLLLLLGVAAQRRTEHAALR